MFSRALHENLPINVGLFRIITFLFWTILVLLTHYRRYSDNKGFAWQHMQQRQGLEAVFMTYGMKILEYIGE